MPPEIASQLEGYRKKHNFTKSELIRHALRELFYRQFPVYKPTPQEIKKIEAGRKAFARGEYTSLNQAFNELDYKNRQTGSKRPGKTVGKRQGKN